jgi:hypothetical protein
MAVPCRSRMKYFLKQHIDNLEEPVCNVVIGYKLDIKGFEQSDNYRNGGDEMMNFFLTTPNIWWSYCHGINGTSDPDPEHSYLGLTFSEDITMDKLTAIIKEIETDEEIQEIRRKFGENCSKEIRITSYLYDDFPKVIGS